jgi:hypothetical protein
MLAKVALVDTSVGVTRWSTVMVVGVVAKEVLPTGVTAITVPKTVSATGPSTPLAVNMWVAVAVGITV